MDLLYLLPLINRVAGYRELKKEIIELPESEIKLKVPNGARPYLVAALAQELNVPILVVMSQPNDARRLYDELESWCHDSTSLNFFPETDFLTGEVSVASETVPQRLQALSELARYRSGPPDGQKIPVVVCSASAAASKTSPPSDFKKFYTELKVAMKVDPLHLVGELQEAGYDLENIVEVPGTICRRGGIMDIYPTNSELPVRVEFSGNEIESIRLFDPKSQLSSGLLKSVTIAPGKECYKYTADVTILDYISESALLILDDLNEIEAVISRLNQQINEFRPMKTLDGESGNDFDSPVVEWSEIAGKIMQVKRRLVLCAWDIGSSEDVCLKSLPFSSLPGYGGRLDIFLRELPQILKQNSPVLVVSQQVNRLYELLQAQGIPAQMITHLAQIPAPGFVLLVHGSLAEGWSLADTMIVFTDNEVFGFVKQRRLSRRRPVRQYRFTSELNPGDYVVHIDHGISKFTGLTKIPVDDIEREFLVLEYAAGDKLYVPTDHIDRVSRYIGAGDQPPKLSRLNTQEWARTKLRVKKSVVDMAQELLQLYAARETIQGFAFSADSHWQRELESSFPYVETRDQLEAVQAVKHDMEIKKPMDRVICGDVGYGKTEIAVRAAFKAVMDNKQVALLVPTTILANQHLFTFKERLQAFPVRIEVLSRLCSESEQMTIIGGLATGMVDICIGTHRLLQKDVVFKDLGLLIIDEEQRFGVAHKEHFKKLRQEVDVLTLSATPIPRTLHMSLAGIRDLSVMETPPEERLPITTYVGAYDDRLIREAILREQERNGQTFFVHNRIQSIHSVTSRLQSLVPEAKMSVAHGRMPHELDKVMAEFGSRKSDVLVTTTIIESGLDMPNVNTIIIDEADKVGLTQLYQLRGRVGRGGSNARAYFLFKRGKQLTPQAKKRLKTISEATELGAGFAIAMKDLEIRGAGNLLGVEQSGYMAAVGFDLYCRLLAEAVDELKQGQVGITSFEKPQVYNLTIDLPLVSNIPEDYISDMHIRISYYQRFAAVKEVYEIENISNELKDRFGALPLAMINLLYITRIKQMAIEAKVESIMTKDKQITVLFSRGKDLTGLQLPDDLKVGVTTGVKQIKLDIGRLGDRWQGMLKRILQVTTTNS